MTSVSDRNAWERAWKGLGVAAPAPNEYEELMRHYGEAHRAYHTRQHLEECLSQLERVRPVCAHVDEVALALWYHDAIYKPRRSDNEALSAEWLARVAQLASVTAPAIERMRELVLATRHDMLPSGTDAQILVDIDLSILGAPPNRFDEYERQVRSEYRWVLGTLYRQGRARILKSFIDRPRIYSTKYFFERLEFQARENIARSLSTSCR